VHQLYREGKVWHLRPFPDLEDEQVSWKPDDPDSPNRIDALVHGITELLLQRVGTLRQS
jgi:phage terminase large subunit-like protein